MHRNLRALTDGVFDVLIIGGGIFGAGIARDAALRGLRVALVEQADFASGTSSRSSKLIHGGFRYLEQRAFSLVAESTRERRILLDIAPHRVRPLPLLLPVYAGDPRPLWKMRVGMTLYDLLAMYRNTAAHRTLSPRAARDLEPSLGASGMLGAIRYFDCQEDDARLVIDNLLDADARGARCANYCEVIGFAFGSAGTAATSAPSDRAGNARIVAARVRDRISQQQCEIRARVFVNAAGPWVERVAGLAEAPPSQVPRLGPTKGVHILLPPLTQSHGIFFQNRPDGRMIFVLPWNGCTLVGTTDTDFTGDPSDVHATSADASYLLEATRSILPGSDVTKADVITTFAGVRPLLRSADADPSARSRDHRIVRQNENMLSVAGGKYTTFRLIAQQVVDEVYRLLGSRPPRCRTATTPLPDPRTPAAGEKIADKPEIWQSDIERAARNEMAITLEDVMRRRVGLSISRFDTPEIVERVGRIMAAVAGWDDRALDDQIAAYAAARSSELGALS